MLEVCTQRMSFFFFFYLESGGIQPSMGHTTRLLLNPSEYRELSWKAKLNACSSLLIICTVSRASLPGKETLVLSESLLLAELSQQILVHRQAEALVEGLQLWLPLGPNSLAADYLFFLLLSQ